MSFWEKAQYVDRRVIYTLLFIVMIGILLRPVGLAIDIRKETRAAYDAVDKLPKGSIIWLGAEFDAASAPELMPALTSVMRQAFKKDLRVVSGAMWEQGGNMLDRAWNAVKDDFPGKQYGVDFVNYGFKPGSGILLQKMLDSVEAATLGIDHYKKPLSELPLAKEFKSFKQAQLVFAFVAGDPGQREYTNFVTDPNKIPLMCAATSVSVPGLMPMLQSGQVGGMIMGLSGAAEYEMLVEKPGRAVAGMDAQSFTHLLIIVFIILGNVGYLLTKGQKKT